MRRAATVLTIVACVASCKSDKQKSQAKQQAVTTTPTPEVAAAAAPLDVTALQLFDAYKGNAIGADEKYRGKALRVIGIVDHVARSGAGPFLDFRVHGSERVQAHFVDDKGLGSIKAGLDATVRCFGDGEFGGPQLKDCVLELAR